MRFISVCLALIALVSAYTRFNPVAAQEVSSPTVAHREAHSKGLQKDYGGAEFYIPDLLRQGLTKDIVIRKNHSAGYTGAPLGVPAYPPYELVANTCTSDAVVFGSVGDAWSDVTEDGHFLYTDVEFTIQQVLAKAAGLQLEAPAKIVVTRPGGQITANGHVLRAVDPGFHAFTKGQVYLLYLVFIQETGAYRATAEGSYLVGDDYVQRVAGLSNLHMKDRAELFRAAADAVSDAHARNCGGAQ